MEASLLDRISPAKFHIQMSRNTSEDLNRMPRDEERFYERENISEPFLDWTSRVDSHTVSSEDDSFSDNPEDDEEYVFHIWTFPSFHISHV